MSDGLKVTVVSFGYPPATIGGAEIYAHRLACRMAGLGHTVQVVTAVDAKDQQREYEVDGIPVRAMYVSSKPPLSKVTYTYNPGTLRKDFGGGDIAHVHNFGAFSPTLFTNLKKAGRHRGVVWTGHDYLMMCPRQTLLRKDGTICGGPEERACDGCKNFKDGLRDGFVNKHFVPNVDRFIAPSRFMLGVFEKAGLPKERLRLVYNGIDLSEFEATDVPGEPRLLFLGQIMAHKGLMNVIEAMPKLLEKVPDAGLMVLGSGPEEENVKARIKELDIGASVDMLGRVPDVKEYYRKARAVVLPSVWHENCSLVLLESLAQGRPVVATRLGGNPEIIADGETGYLYRHDDIDELSEKLARVLGSDVAVGFGKAARVRAEKRFSMDVAVKENLGLYEELLEG